MNQDHILIPVDYNKDSEGGTLYRHVQEPNTRLVCDVPVCKKRIEGIYFRQYLPRRLCVPFG